MLIQNIKSRNLWLWGETVMPTSETSEGQQLKSEIQDLDKENKNLSSKLTQINRDIMGAPADKKEELQSSQFRLTKGLSINNKSLEEKKSDLSTLASSGDAKVNNVGYTRTYTTPFKITALQSMDITWDNPIGESYGIKTNFLQAWHNKPVSINFSGLSYIGAFGGQTVGDLAQASNTENSNFISKSNEWAGNLLGTAQNVLTNTVQDITNNDSAEYAKGKYYTVVDDDIYQINKLMSLYGEGMFTSVGADKASSWIHLVLENEPGSNGSNQYAAFVGHIRNFNYKERVDQPFMYDFTCQFIGEPTISEKVGQGQIEAKQDSSSLKLSLVTSNSGFSLGYGF